MTGFHDGLSAIANVDQAGSVTVHDGNYSALHIRSSATDPNALILVSTMMQRLSVAGGSPVLQASSPLAAIPSFAEWSADGQRFVISAVGADLGAWEFDPVSLTKTQAEYRTSVFARAGAVYPDSSRLVLAADRTDHQSGVELHVYRFSDGEKILRLLLDVNMPAADDGLRFSPDGSAMFLLLGGGMGPALLALPGDPRQGEISIDAPDAVPYGSSVVVDLPMNAESDNRTVRVCVRPAGGDKELVADRSVGSGGDLRVRLTDLRADSTVTVEWDGDGDSAARKQAHHPRPIDHRGRAPRRLRRRGTVSALSIRRSSGVRRPRDAQPAGHVRRNRAAEVRRWQVEAPGLPRIQTHRAARPRRS